MFLEYKSGLFGKISFWLVSIFIITFPFLNYTSFLYFGTVSRFINTTILASVLSFFSGLLLLNKKNNIKVPKNLTLLFLILYFASISLSSVFGIDLQNSWYSPLTRTSGLWFFVSLGLLTFFLIDLLRDTERREKLIKAIVFSSAIFSFISLFSSEGLNWIFKSYQIDGFTFGNSTFAGMYLFGAFLFSCYLMIQKENKGYLKYILPVMIIINPYILAIGTKEGKGILSFIGEARASSIILMFSIFLLLIMFGISKIKSIVNKKRLSWLIFGLYFISVLFATLSLFKEDGIVRNFYNSQSNQERILVWNKASELTEQRPFLGFGLDNFEKTFERNYDNHVLEGKSGGEPWFDRVHNIWLDQIFENGYIGLIFYIAAYFVCILTLLKSVFCLENYRDKVLSVILILYLGLHIGELQTAFDTTISYMLLSFVFALSIVLQESAKKENKYFELNGIFKYFFSVCIIAFSTWSIFWGIYPFIRSQVANNHIRNVGSAEKRLPYYKDLFDTPIDQQAVLWRTWLDFKRGIGENPRVLENQNTVNFLKQEISLYEEYYQKYLEKHPNSLRAILNYADIKIYFMLFGVNKLDEAQTVLDQAIELVPQAPQSYWMKSVAYLYMRKFDLAKEYAQKSFDLNPDIVESQNLLKYIDKSIKTFPEIDLYFFSKI